MYHTENSAFFMLGIPRVKSYFLYCQVRYIFKPKNCMHAIDFLNIKLKITSTVQTTILDKA